MLYTISHHPPSKTQNLAPNKAPTQPIQPTKNLLSPIISISPFLFTWQFSPLNSIFSSLSFPFSFFQLLTSFHLLSLPTFLSLPFPFYLLPPFFKSTPHFSLSPLYHPPPALKNETPAKTHRKKTYKGERSHMKLQNWMFREDEQWGCLHGCYISPDTGFGFGGVED